MNETEFLGSGSIAKLKDILQKHSPKNIFLVTGKSSYEKSGAKKAIETYLAGYNTIHFTDFDANPKIEQVETGIGLFKESKCDFVIAIGGGSAMDIAKAINVLAANEEEALEYIEKRANIEKRGKVLVAIPTTSGSGSEATKFAVVNVGQTKKGLQHDFMIPDYTIVDYQFTHSLPKSITASTGMDALSQGIESYWSICSTDESKKFAGETVQLIIKHLATAVNEPSEESREGMAKAAFLSGKAINISRTTACHAISYPITSYFGVPHGHAVALTLAEMLLFNADVTEEDLLDERGIDYVKNTIKEIIKLMGASNADEASKQLNRLMDSIGLSKSLNELNMKTDDDIEVIIKNGFDPNRVKNNPRRLTEQKLREMLQRIR